MTERAESAILTNAWCLCCDAIANGTTADLCTAGWQPIHSVDGWYCPDCNQPFIDAEVIDGQPWWATWGPHTLEAMCAPMPAVDRSHWTLTGPDVVVVKGELVRYADDQMRMAA